MLFLQGKIGVCILVAFLCLHTYVNASRIAKDCGFLDEYRVRLPSLGSLELPLYAHLLGNEW